MGSNNRITHYKTAQNLARKASVESLQGTGGKKGVCQKGGGRVWVLHLCVCVFLLLLGSR